jgi:hypothetical protein
VAPRPIVWLIVGTVGVAIMLMAENAAAVRPFITDDARIVYKGQLETESYAGLVLDHRDKPAFEIRSLQGMSVTDRLEIIAGGFGLNYQDRQARPLDMVFQPKYVINRSFGAIPSVSAAAAILFPLSGNRQQWNSYSMVHVSWFLFTPQTVTDPYDNGLAIHVNLGAKSQYDAGLGGRYTSKVYWAAGFEVITLTRNVRYLGEIFNGDPFTFEEEFPAFQTGFRWYKTPSVQMDFVLRGVRNGAEEARPGEDVQRHWSYTVQVGLRVLFDVFR